jgi:hypothetical protein
MWFPNLMKDARWNSITADRQWRGYQFIGRNYQAGRRSDALIKRRIEPDAAFCGPEQVDPDLT